MLRVSATSGGDGPALLWFRRDLRLADNPALLAARDAAAAGVVAVFVLDDRLLRTAGPVRRAFLFRCLRDLDAALDGQLCVRTGDPAVVVPALARQLGARSVHAAADFAPYGAARDAAVEAELAADGRQLLRTGSPYAVTPGRVRKADGSPFRVFTPFYRAWTSHGWRAPAVSTGPTCQLDWITVASDGVPIDPPLRGVELPPAGEAAAHDRLRVFAAQALDGYAARRELPAAAATSRLSPYLKFGCLHPRTVLAEVAQADLAGEADPGSVEKFRAELGWREFYADVLAVTPDSARWDLTPTLADLVYDEPGPEFDAWQRGETGFPIVDAGMRQLRAEGWVHNRVRMIEASFVCKDLHLHWSHGARFFMRHLVDGDLASNNHGWQWTAGTGTDAAPYFRVFNPVSQGKKYDPDGAYVRRWVPELRGLPAATVHEPWMLPAGPPPGYPRPVVDHAATRREALNRYAAARPPRGQLSGI